VELADGPTLYVRWQGQDIYLVSSANPAVAIADPSLPLGNSTAEELKDKPYCFLIRH
jgi:hypothetical protein